MIVTVTPSPAVDWTVSTDSFDLDAVNRAGRSTREASGKGVNVSWALHRAGVPTTTVFPGGGQTGQFMDDALSGAGMPFTRVDTGQEVRTNITLITPGHSTKINEPGVELTESQLTQLTDAAVAATVDARAVLVCGSLPPSMSAGQLRDLVAELRTAGTGNAEVVVDSSGDPLTAALEAAPSLIKPNVHELSEVVGRDISTLGEVVAAAHLAIQAGAGAVLASLGADGAMYIDGTHAVFAAARDIPFVNSVGAGDALLSGFMAVQGTPSERLHNAVLWASSAVAHESTLFPVRPDFDDRISVSDVFDNDTPLSEPSVPLVPTTRSERKSK
ncbi:MAG: 1-phosphofructokinase family hexose kinase [Corynebacterium sp.]|uniref:1-phosphofructokinase family hexose kinase n=1 Tax=Corynebacterium sp. TaxID=1720 RepID=UPI003F96DD15